jgi:hypothetical protein
MRKLTVSCLFIFMCLAMANSQTGDGCHAYVVDVATVEKMSKSGADCKDESKCGVTTFPEFKPKIGEEELTKKTFKFPQSPLIITANVFFTDEMLASSKGRDSILLSITLAPTELKDALSDENSAVAEFSLGEADAVRVKRFYKVSGKTYLVGLECHIKKVAH